MQFGEHHLVQALPDPCLDPLRHPAAAGRVGTEPELDGRGGPLDVGMQYEHDAMQAPMSRQPLTVGMVEILVGRGYQRLDEIP